MLTSLNFTQNHPIELSNKSCDRCLNWKKKCSKHLEGCLRCLLSNVECTYLIPRQRTRKSKAPTLQLGEYHEALPTNRKLTTLAKNLSLPQLSTFDYQVTSLAARSDFLIMLTGIANLRLYTQDASERLMIVGLIGALNTIRPDLVSSKKKPKPVRFLCHPPAIYGSDDLRNRATNAFFWYFNSSLPVFASFTPEAAKERSRLIQLLIYAIGLKLMEISIAEIPFLDLLHQEIYTLTFESTRQPKLETIQALFLISAMLYNIPIFYKLMRYSVYNLIALCHLLGLHQVPSYIATEDQLERYLTYTTVVQHIKAGALMGRKHLCFSKFITSIPSVSSKLIANNVLLLFIASTHDELSQVADSVIAIKFLIHGKESTCRRVVSYLDVLLANIKQMSITNLAKLKQISKYIQTIGNEASSYEFALNNSQRLYILLALYSQELYGHITGMPPTSVPNPIPKPLSPKARGEMAKLSLNLLNLSVIFKGLPYVPDLFFFLSVASVALAHSSKDPGPAFARAESYLNSFTKFPLLLPIMSLHQGILKRLSNRPK